MGEKQAWWVGREKGEMKEGEEFYIAQQDVTPQSKGPKTYGKMDQTREQPGIHGRRMPLWTSESRLRTPATATLLPSQNTRADLWTRLFPSQRHVILWHQ